MSPTDPFEPLSLADAACPAGEIDWLWDGYLAPGNLTLLTSQWRCGKTTLLAVLLARLRDGGSLAGRAVRPGRVMVVSGEVLELWRKRIRHLDLVAHVGWLCRPFSGRPTRDDWTALIDFLGRRRAAGELDLLVIDPLAAFLPGRSENHSGTILDALIPLQQLTKLGVAVLVLHEPRKGEAAAGPAARGGGALSGAVDILIEMTWHGEAFGVDRRRRLRAFSRHGCTPRRLLVQWSDDGTDYVALGDTEADDFTSGREVLFTVLDEADYKLTRRKMLEQWPPDHVRPVPMTLWRWLERAVTEGKVLRQGRGTRLEPFRYWLPSQIERWRSDPKRLPDEEDMDWTNPLADIFEERRLLRAASKVRRRMEEDEEESQDDGAEEG